MIYYWIDHTAKCTTNTGMQRVTRCLARALIDNGEDIIFVCWNSERRSLVLATQDDLKHLARFNGPPLGRVPLARYPSVTEVRELHKLPSFFTGDKGWLLVPEVTHITYHEEPPTLDAILYASHHGLKTAFIFYDAIPLKLSEYADSAEAHAIYMQQIAISDLVVPISQFAAKDYSGYLKKFLCFDDSTLPRVQPLTLPGEIPECVRARRLVRNWEETIILSVGTLEPRKNQVKLIDAFERLCARYPKTPIRLVMVGNLHPAVAGCVHEAVQRNPNISYLEYVSDAELVELYRRSTFTVFPSVEEGFGLPILESLWHGKPCICANFGAMDEVAQDGGCMRVDVRSVQAMTSALEKLTNDENVWGELGRKAVERNIKSWEEYGKEFCQLLYNTSNPATKVRRILYWVEHTCMFPYNTGIQRVTRLLAKTLMAEGVELVPVKWDPQNRAFISPTPADLDYLANWSGPTPDAWTISHDFTDGQSTWLLIPELTAYPSGPDLCQVVEYARCLRLRSAIIFYDAIPYKMPDSCPPLATELHRAYMEALDHFDLVIAISEHSRVDLHNFLTRKKTRLISLEKRLIAIDLPGEFIDVARVTRYEEPLVNCLNILSVGTIERRKNHAKMFNAFLAAKKRTNITTQLTVVGRVADDLREELRDYIERSPAIKWVDHVNDNQLKELYSLCHFTVYPSLEEGFGLPILESLWHGKPCICRDRGAMAEAAQGGGCLLVDTADETQLTAAITRLIEDGAERARLGREATSRPFKTWRDYSKQVLSILAEGSVGAIISEPATPVQPKLHSPLLSICITTYNRSAWLDVSLKQIAELITPYTDVVELIVCDNASSDDTENVCAQYRELANFRYFRNPLNVGMLGNLRETVHHARGRFVWILGDDDIPQAGAVEKILRAILENPNVALIYLNYAYTRNDAPRDIKDIDKFLIDATPITPSTRDCYAAISELSTLSENFFTAIYCLVFRRDHAIKAYSQDTVGRPFSSLLTCIPTAHYVCNYMFGEMGYWIGEPCVVVNMNVSWMKYAPLWVLERLPELYELAEIRGANPAEVDRWRVHNLAGALNFLPAIYFEDSAANLEYFSFGRFIRRHKHLPEFRTQLLNFVSVYQKAYDHGLVKDEGPADELLSQFGLSV